MSEQLFQKPKLDDTHRKIKKLQEQKIFITNNGLHSQYIFQRYGII